MDSGSWLGGMVLFLGSFRIPIAIYSEDIFPVCGFMGCLHLNKLGICAILLIIL